MTEQELDNLIDISMEGLRIQNEAHASTWGLGSAERWDVDQEEGSIIWSFEDGKIAQAEVQIIASFKSDDGSFVWGWANSSIVDALKTDALKVKEFGEKNDLEFLTAPRLKVNEGEAWELAALANHLNETNGVYRGPTGPNLFLFLTFGQVKISKKT